MVHDVLLIVIGWVIPTFLGWAMSKTPYVREVFRGHPFLTAIAVSFLVAISVSITVVVLYSKYFPENSTVNVETSERNLGVTYPNKSGRTLIIMVTAVNSHTGNTMCGNISKDSSIPPSQPHLVLQDAEVCTSFASNTVNNSITFVVPPGYYYSVTTDGADTVRLVWWAAASL